MLAVVYNPSVFEQEYSVLSFDSPNFLVQVFDREKGKFVATEAEAMCYTNPDNKTECEVYVFHPVPPMSYDIIQFVYSTEA